MGDRAIIEDHEWSGELSDVRRTRGGADRRPRHSDSAQRSEAGPQLLDEKFRLLEGGEMPALGQPVVVDQLADRPAPPSFAAPG